MKTVTMTWNDDDEANSFLAIYTFLERTDQWAPGQPAIMKRSLRAAHIRILGGDNERSGSNDSDTGGRNIVRGA